MLIRSILFYILLGLWTILMGILYLPLLLLPNNYLRKPINIWILGIFKLLEFSCNITYEIKGRENIPQYPVIIASKHQSAFETFALFYYLDKSIFIHKKQLFNIPIFGQYLKKINMIAIDRLDGTKAMRKMLNEVNSKILEGFSIIIFPEGTRKKPNESADYKSGIAGIYRATEVDILPIAVNSGYCWPKHTFIKKSGHIIISIMKKIPSGLERARLLNELEFKIEEETKKISNK